MFIDNSSAEEEAAEEGFDKVQKTSKIKFRFPDSDNDEDSDPFKELEAEHKAKKAKKLGLLLESPDSSPRVQKKPAKPTKSKADQPGKN